MYTDIREFCSELKDLFSNEPGDVFYWLIGKEVSDCNGGFMNNLLSISGRAINEMYMCTLRKSVGV